jgi:aspartate aminotransferase
MAIVPLSSLDRWLGPQRELDRLREHHLMRSRGQLIDLAYPNPDDALDPAIRAALEATLADVEGKDLQYTPYGGATVPRRHVARSLAASHGLSLRYDDVVLTPGAMSALQVALATAADSAACDSAAGTSAVNEVVIVTPCWLDTPLYVARLGLEPVLVPVERPSGTLDVDAIARAITDRTCAVVVVQPGNPTGVLYDEASLRSLADVLTAARSSPLLISDESHSAYVFGGATFVSPASVYPRSAIVYSFGKAWRMQGQRLGYVAFRPEFRDQGWAAKAVLLCRAMGYATPTAFMQRALARLLEIPHDLSAIERRRARCVRVLADAGYELSSGRHTMFVYGRAPGGDALAFVEEAANEGVLVVPSTLFHETGHFRVSVTASDDLLDTGLRILTRLGPATTSFEEQQ